MSSIEHIRLSKPDVLNSSLNESKDRDQKVNFVSDKFQKAQKINKFVVGLTTVKQFLSLSAMVKWW